jgi:hypothetical protein
MRRILAGIIFLASSVAYASGPDWPPVDRAELALKAPKVEPDADAEALLWDVRVSHESEGGIKTVRLHYLRIKIFNDRGREKFTTVDIEFRNGEKISDIAARTIRPNGEIVELKKDAVYERVLVKTRGVKVKVKSFALPAVEAGAIVEYRWRDTLSDELTDHFRLQFQREIPIQSVKYHIKPLAELPYGIGMRSLALHMQTPAFVKEPGGFYGVSAANVPAFKEEPDMPAEPQVRPWLLIYYAKDTDDTPDKYWDKIGKKIYEEYKDQLKVNDEMRNAAGEIVKGAANDEEKLQRLFDFVRKSVKNTHYEGETSDRREREKLKENRNTVDTWKQKTGSGYEINLLFMALAQSQGFDARLMATADRSYGPFNKDFTDLYFLRSDNVAVKVGDHWRFCDPSSPLLPFGMLDSDEEGQGALITDPKQPVLVVTPISAPAASQISRRGTFRLQEDGVLEGDVVVDYTGHDLENRKRRYQEQSPAEREEAVKKGIQDRFPLAEVTAIKVEGVSENLEPLKVSYHVKIEAYAEKTGRRLFLKCSYFNRSNKPRYSSAQRRYPVMFDHAWTETESVTYALPAGYSLEKAEAPTPLRVGGLGEQRVRMTINTATKVLTFERNFIFGTGGGLSVPASSYKDLKMVFDRFQEMDEHTLIVKQDAAGGSN